VFDVIVRPLFRSLSRPLFRALTGLVSAITKVLIDLSPTSSSFYSIGSDVVLTTSYKLCISTVLPTASTTYALYGRASSATDYFKILSSGYLSLDVNGTVVTSTVLATKDSQYREYSVTLSGNDFIFKENDTVISTVTNATAAAKTLTLNLIGNSNGAEFYLGVLADPVMGPLAFKLNKLTDNFELPVGNVFGSELWVNPILQTGWTDNGGGSYTLNNNGDYVKMEVNGLTIGAAYEYSLTIDAIDEPLAIRGSTVYSNFNSVGSKTGVFVADDVDFVFSRLTPGNAINATVSSITLKEVTNFITYQNIGTGRSFRETYTLIDDNYFGTQTVVNPDFATDSDWSKGTNIAISGGQAVFASAPNNQGIAQSGVADEGGIFDVTVTLSGYVEGGLQVRNPFEDFTPAAANGVFTFTGIVDNTSAFLRADGVTTLNIDSVTARRRIEVAS
jgi:hypothetical protein